MTLNRVYLAAGEHDDGLALAYADEADQYDTKPQAPSALTTGKNLARSRFNLLFMSTIVRQIDKVRRHLLVQYSQLSWATRETIHISISLFAVLYMLVSVPFRIGFLYNPLDTTEERWTTELSFLTSVDVVADLIGVIEFVAVYQLWKNTVSHEAEMEHFGEEAKRMRGSKRSQESKYPARLAFDARQGKPTWTIANISHLASDADDHSGDNTYEHQSLTTRNWELALEVAALLPLELIPLAMGAFNWLHLVRVTKLCRGYQLRRCFSQLSTIYADRLWVQHASSAGIRSLVRNAALCVVGCHWAACGYMFIAHAQCGVSLEDCSPDEETSWVVRDRLLGATLARKYGRTIYWAARTMVLLGYDDITPVSSAETVYAIVAQLAGALFCSSTLATFLFIFKFRNARYAAYSEHVDNAREYMHSKNIPRAIRHQVVAYFRYSWNTHHSLDSEGVLRRMPRHLQSKVTATLKASRIRQVCFLAKATVEFINSLALTLERCVYSPTDQIVEPKASAQMFFIIRGNVALSGSNPRDCIGGDFFGEICLLFPKLFDEKAVAKSFCELYVLTKAKFDDVVSQFHHGSESVVLAEMAEVLEKYTSQQRKMKLLLGDEGANGSSSRTLNRRTSNHQVGMIARKTKASTWRSPESSFRQQWETLRLVAAVYVAFEVPFHAVFIAMIEGENMFAESSPVTFRYICTLLVELFFLVDIVIRARYLIFVDPVALLSVASPSLIFAAYKKNGFYLDLIALLPAGILADSLITGSFRTYVWILRLPRLLRMRLIPSLLSSVRDSRGISSKLFLFISILLAISLTLHFVAITWFEMAWIPRAAQGSHDGSETLAGITRAECLQHATLFNNCSWVKFDCYGHVGTVFPAEDGTSTYGNSFAYTRAVYWAVVALTAVGYGDIVAFSTAESYFAAVWIFIGGIVNLGVLGAMSSTISNAMAVRHHHLELLNTVNSIMGRLSISSKLSAEVRRFYHQQFRGRRLAYESQLLSNLPDQLSYQISSLLHADAVKSVALFDSASIDFLQEVTGKFRHRTYQNGETICLEGDVCREFLVFLSKSKVNVFFRTRKVPARALHEGDCYGVNEFLLQRAHSATLVAASTVHASVMTREQFDGIQRKFEDDLRDMSVEAQALWSEQQMLLRRIVINLESLKLKPHAMQTPTLFYQRDFAADHIKTQANTVRDDNALRTSIGSVWTAGTMLWNVYNAFFVFFRIGFHSHLHFSHSASTAVWVADLCGDLYLAMDIYLRLYYLGCPEADLSNLVTRRLVDQGYRRSGGFKWDLVASMPLYVPMASGSLVVSVCRLPRLIRCLDLWTYLDDIIVQVQQHFASRKVSAYLGPVKLMIVVAFASHVVGSIFLFNSDRECKSIKNCWLAHDYLIHKYDHALWMIYIKAMYWAITTLLLTSSREIAPRDMVGTLWVIFTCLLCTFAMGYVVGEVSDLIMALDKESKQHKGRITNFESFAKKNKFTEILRDRVKFFFRAEFEATEGHDLGRMVEQLPASLRIKFMLEIYGQALYRLPIIHFLTISQINNLALRLQSEVFIPGDSIIVEGSLGNRLLTLNKGSAAVFWTRSVTTVAVLVEGALFGEISFFIPEQRRLTTVRAITSCEVLYVSKHDWQELWPSTGDQNDMQEQKYALHSILSWVSTRLGIYQRRNTILAAKVARELGARKEAATQRLGGASKTKAPTLRSILRKGSSKQLSLSLNSSWMIPREVKAVEMKAKYLLLKGKECTKQLQNVAEAKQSSSYHTLEASRRSFRQSVLPRGISRENKGESSRKGSSLDAKLNQFIVHVNPVNRHLRASLTDDQIQRLETECWSRFKLVSAIHHRLDGLLTDLMPPSIEVKTQSDGAQQPRHRATAKATATLTQMPSRSRTETRDDINLVKYSQTAGVSVTTRQDQKDKASKPRLAPAKSTLPRDRRVSTGWTTKRDIKGDTERVATLARMKRCRSLPHFDSHFFENARNEALRGLASTDSIAAGADIDFEVLQRCERPRYESQIRLYHQYRIWVGAGEAREKQERKPVQVRKTKRMSLEYFQIVKRRQTTAAVGVYPANRLLAGNESLRIDMVDSQTKVFIQRLKRMGKVWETVMLVAVAYYVLVTPFKACFPHDLSKLPGRTLRAWAGLEIFLDVLCVLDIGYKLREALLSTRIGSSSSHVESVRRFVMLHSDLLVDVIAILPLELLLSTTGSGAPLTYEPTADSRWWTTRWLLRLNRMLLVRRVQPLSESLLQYIIYDCNVSVNEPVVSFVRAFASYLTMAHFLACLWFATSNYSMHVYVISWLSTSGMLTYITPQTSTSVETLIRFVQDIPLGRKYLRSLLFSMECITTLFYGDVVSMNELELIAEVTITIWCTYLYGALVGAQGELLDSNVRLEATFEQNLGELQLYLLENEAPKQLKRQIKAYYAHKWHRSRGDNEFTVIERVSSVLYEEVVFAALRPAAARIEAFYALDETFLRGLLVRLKYVICSEGEEVVVTGDVDRSMYFISRGRLVANNGEVETLLKSGQFFGELALLYGVPRLATCTTVAVTELYRLDHQPYERLLDEFPEYRVRNKVVWTTVSRHRTGSPDDPSYQIYRTSMELLARLEEMDPVDAKTFILKCRTWASKQPKDPDRNGPKKSPQRNGVSYVSSLK